MPASPLPSALLVDGDPPPFELHHGVGGAPLLLICDHASRAIPRALGQLGVAEDDLRKHIGWDIGAAAVTRRLAALLDAPAVLAGYSRLVVDCNRDPEDPTSMPEASDGIAVPGNMRLDAAARAARIAGCFRPYHEAIAGRLADFARGGTVPAMFSIHSFTPRMNGFVRPWHVGVLWDRDPRLPVPLMANLAAADPQRVVGDNQPYSAREPAGYSIRRHAVLAGLPHAAVEIRQDLIESESGAAFWAEALAEALRPILADPKIYRAERF